MGEIVQHLVAVHPPLAINGILTNEPAWTERSLAYHLTNLNQDVPIRLPANAAACAATAWNPGFGLVDRGDSSAAQKCEPDVLKTAATRLQ